MDLKAYSSFSMFISIYLPLMKARPLLSLISFLISASVNGIPSTDTESVTDRKVLAPKKDGLLPISASALILWLLRRFHQFGMRHMIPANLYTGTFVRNV